jgi:large subunit ribosomal protein L24
MKKFKIKTGDYVQVMSGKDRGKKGKVLKVLRDKDRVLVEGINIITKRVKPTAENPQGGLVEKEAPIHISNVMLVDPKSGEPTRVGHRFDENGNKIRYAKKSGEQI